MHCLIRPPRWVSHECTDTVLIHLYVEQSCDMRSSAVKEARRWCNWSQLLIRPVHWYGYRHSRQSEGQVYVLKTKKEKESWWGVFHLIFSFSCFDNKLYVHVCKAQMMLWFKIVHDHTMRKCLELGVYFSNDAPRQMEDRRPLPQLWDLIAPACSDMYCKCT